MTLIQECVPAPESIQKPQLHKRRHSFGSVGNALLQRASSFSRLLQRQGSKRSCKQDESTEHSEGNDDENPFHNDEEQLGVVSQQVKESILKLQKCESVISKQVDSNLALALARYTAGASNTTGAILSMRKAHKNKDMLCHTVATRRQLVDLRMAIKDAIQCGNYMGMEADQQRQEMKQILLKLKQEQANYATPSDEQLINQLKQHLLEADIWDRTNKMGNNTVEQV